MNRAEKISERGGHRGPKDFQGVFQYKSVPCRDDGTGGDDGGGGDKRDDVGRAGRFCPGIDVEGEGQGWAPTGIERRGGWDG
eukprot:COSAG02_NODE_1761_length_11029_cov_46.691034_6_plen_82_part_00